VIPVVVGSSPIGHPTFPRKWQPPEIDCAGTPGAARRRLVDAALAQMAANVAGAIDGRDPEYLHQLRVGVRRLRTVFRIFKTRRLDRRLRKLARPLGEARDWDVFVARHAKGMARRRAAHRRCRRVLESAEFRAFIIDARQPDARVPQAPLTAFAAKALDRLHRKALKRARGIDWHDEKRRHRLRIAVRRLRYGCDFFAACFDDARRYLRGLADLQDLLGELNDIAVARRFGAAGLEKRERALISELAPAWKSFGKRPRFWAGIKRPRAAAS
jgi:triphosphatase